MLTDHRPSLYISATLRHPPSIEICPSLSSHSQCNPVVDELNESVRLSSGEQAESDSSTAEREIYTGRSENTYHDHRTDRRAAQANISNKSRWLSFNPVFAEFAANVQRTIQLGKTTSWYEGYPTPC